ncbi:adhesion G protein-coupled receptor E3-like [Chlamydotis macqueenii]
MGSVSPGRDPDVRAGMRPWGQHLQGGPSRPAGGAFSLLLGATSGLRPQPAAGRGQGVAVGRGWGEAVFGAVRFHFPSATRAAGPPRPPSAAMGRPRLAACLWALCHLLSHLPRSGGNRTTFGPNPASCCGVPALRAGPGPESTQQLLAAACAQPTQGNLQKALEQLQTRALTERHANATQLLLQSTEALVLHAALKIPSSGPQNFNTSTMAAAVEVVRDGCPRATLVLAVGEESLAIRCHEVLSHAQAGKQAVAFIVYKEAEDLLKGATEKLNSPVVGGSVGTPGVTFNVTFNITLRHRTVGAAGLAHPLPAANPGAQHAPVPFRPQTGGGKGAPRRAAPRAGRAPQALRAGEEPRCVSWRGPGTASRWTSRGCARLGGDALRSVCACTHFSTFAVLVAVHPDAESFALTVVSSVGLSVSLLCLFLAILTFLLCRSLWSVSVALHLQLSICLFAADLLFLATVHRTANRLACAITAGFLHYLFLACFAWMFLEGLHLFLTVRNLRVLNYTSASRFRKRYIYAVGYGTPAIVVAISAAVHPGGYGTEKHCWLSVEEGFIWSFLGPVCVIILVNLLFFLTTLWILRDRLSSLNTDATALKNTRLMTFKALAHVCILGCTWGLGLLQARGDTAVAFVFTIVNSLQGAFIFLVHCVLNRQVTEQYRRWLRALRRRAHPPEMPTTETHVTYITEAERPHSHSAEGCQWEK